MPDNRNLKLDLFALALLALVIFLALALLTYHPGDPVVDLIRPLNRLYRPDALVYPPNESPRNLCGYWGALAADMLLSGLGIGSYYLVFSLAAFDIQLLRRQATDAAAIRTAGWCVSLVGLTSLATALFPNVGLGPVVGPGGYLGALGAGLLQHHFALAGALILAMSMFFAGLLIYADYALLRTARYLVVGGVSSAALLSRQARRRVVDDEDFDETDDDEIDEEEDLEGDEETDDAADNGEPVTIRFRGRDEGGESSDEDEAMSEEAEDDEEEDEPQDQEAVTVPAAVTRHLLRKGEPTQARADGGAACPPPVNNRKEKAERDEVMTRLDAAARQEQTNDYELPSIELLIEGEDFRHEDQEKEVRRKAKVLEKTFADFGFQVKVVEIETGPVIAQYEVQLEAGLRLSKITGLADDLAIALRVPSVRIVAPIPGKNTVGIEVPNETRQVVRLREVIEESRERVSKMKIPVFLGKDVSGAALTVDLATLPHLLIAGRTGTGKSVCLNAIICSILMARRPDEVRMLMIDPKMVELSGYARLPHLMHPVVTDMRKAEAILAWAVEQMEERYALLARAGVRHITSYNQLGKKELIDRLQPEKDEEAAAIPESLPFIVIVADEIADLMMTAGKEVEQHIIRLAQKSRAVGIHLILATQKPTVDVITGLIKSNLPARIAFQVASRTDSRVVLDEMGADKLLGNGDMLFLWPGTSTLLRGQGTYVSDDEIKSVVDVCSAGEQHFVHELVNLKVETPGGQGIAAMRKRDDLYEQAVDVVVREGRGSVSLLQRALGVGYGRAARLVDYMAEDGIVGAYAGSQAREVLISVEDWERMQREDAAEAAEPPKGKRRRSTADAAPQAGRKPSRTAKPKPVVHLPPDEDDEDPSSLDDDSASFDEPDETATRRSKHEFDDDTDDDASDPFAEDDTDASPWEDEEADEEGEEDEELSDGDEVDEEEDEYEEEDEQAEAGPRRSR